MISDAPLEGMWATVNVFQLASHLILIDVEYPDNMLQYFSMMTASNDYLSTIPGMPNLFAYALRKEELIMTPVSPTFSARGYDNRNVLLLVGCEIQTICVVLALIPLGKALSQKASCFQKLDSKLRFDVIIRTVVEGFIKISIVAFMNLEIVWFLIKMITLLLDFV